VAVAQGDLHLHWWRHALIALSCLVLALPVLAQPEDPDLAVLPARTPTPTQITFKESDHEVVVLSVTLSDDFEDPAAGVLPEATLDPLVMARRYEAGEYVLEKLDPMSTQIATADVPGIYGDATISLDVRLAGDPTGRSIALGCRRQADSSHYRLTLFPDTGEFLLARWDGSTRIALAGATASAMLLGNATNHVELGCVEETIWVTVNDQVVVSVEDGSYRQGRMWIGVYGSAVTADARFDNLLVRQMQTVERTPVPFEAAVIEVPEATEVPIATATLTPPPSSTPEPTPIATATPLPSPTASPTATHRYDGAWTSGGRPVQSVSFTVRDDRLVAVGLDFLFGGGGCTVEGRLVGPLDAPAAIDRTRFTAGLTQQATFSGGGPGDPTMAGTVSLNLNGEFTTPSLASGIADLSIEVSGDGTRCQGSQRITWTVNKGELPSTASPAIVQGIVFLQP
jgi:hypothetical protein